MSIKMDDASNDLLFVGFNQDNGCFSIGTSHGFTIYNVDPFRESFKRIFVNGGIGIVEMLFRCNILALVGGGRNPRYPTNKVMIWDDKQNKCVGELMFKGEVRAVKLRRDKIVVVLSNKVYVYRFKDLSLIDQITTNPNPKGLVSLCPDPANNVLAVPGLQKGTIRVELYDISKATIIKAHDSELSQFALNIDGSKLASSSDKGTLIRLWDTNTGDMLKELRRGMDRAEIYCLSFNPTSTFLACSSDKGTIHVFSLTNSNSNGSGADAAIGGAGAANASNAGAGSAGAAGSNAARDPNAGRGAESAASAQQTDDSVNVSNKSMNIGFLKNVIPTRFVPKYFDSEWSFAQIHGIEGQSICAFSRDSSKIFVISSDGTFLSCQFSSTGGECQRLDTKNFMHPDDPNSIDTDEFYQPAAPTAGQPAPRETA